MQQSPKSRYKVVAETRPRGSSGTRNLPAKEEGARTDDGGACRSTNRTGAWAPRSGPPQDIGAEGLVQPLTAPTARRPMSTASTHTAEHEKGERGRSRGVSPERLMGGAQRRVSKAL
jgi:hypothetical protein